VVVASIAAAAAIAHADPPSWQAAVAPLPALPMPPPPPMTFAVLSDLHVSAFSNDQPPPAAVRMVAAVAAAHPRLVVITGDFTNGTITDSPGQVNFRVHAFRAIRRLLLPLRAAGIPVLPVAGNHDAYLDGQRRLYAQAFADLDQWAAPLEIEGKKQPADGKPAIDAAPFSYAVDVDGVHLSLGHIVDQHVDPRFGAWLTDDLARAKRARLRLVFGHVPVSSVITPPSKHFLATLGAIFAAGAVDAYIAGHEHITWDEMIELPGHVPMRQILVGTATGRYDYGPTKEEMARAGCVREGAREECHIPLSGTPFEMRPNSHKKWIEDQRATLTLITIDGKTITATPVGVSPRGDLEPFGKQP
jgi:hypothetical protein